MILRGGRPLMGEVALNGAKNALPKIMVAALLTERALHAPQRRRHRRRRHRQRPHRRARRRGLIARARRARDHHGESAARWSAAFSRSSPARAASRFSPAARCWRASAQSPVPSLGGCRIGTRPVDFHLRALQDMGADLHDDTGNAHLSRASGCTATRSGSITPASAPPSR